MELKDLLSNYIYPIIYERAAELFPEMGFSSIKGGSAWVGRSGQKVTGESGERGKVYYYANNPGYLIDYTRGSKSVWDYLKEQYSLGSGGEVLRRLSELSGVPLPSYSLEDEERYQTQRLEVGIWEAANDYFTGQLHALKNTNPAEAQRYQEYLSGRGYQPQDFRFTTEVGVEYGSPSGMELGYYNGDSTILRAYIVNRGYTEQDVLRVINLSPAIGTTHRLTIPYRGAGGTIRGIAARDIAAKDESGKYRYSTDLKRDSTLFNLSRLSGTKSLIIVEGLLDALIATARGVENVVALGGTSLNEAQAKLIKRYQPKRVILCLDYDKAGAEATERVIPILLEQGLKVYVAQLPTGIKDPDELIKAQGVEAFTTAIEEALPYWKHKLDATLSRYAQLQETGGGLTAMQVEDLSGEIVTLGATIKEPIAAEHYKATVTGLDELRAIGLTPEVLQATVERLQFKQDKERQDKELSALLREAGTKQKAGDIEGAIALLSQRATEVKSMDKATAFAQLIEPLREADVTARLNQRPPSLKTGYLIGGNTEEEELLLPAGAISIIAAPTSHGKTTFLINLIHRVVKQYPSQRFYFFSYEEDTDSILISALSTYIGESLSRNNRRSIKAALSGHNQYLGAGSPQVFETKKAQFFRELIDTGRLSIHYTSYSSEELIEAIHYLHKEGNAGGIFIDYMQLLNLPQGKYKTYSRQEELKQICLSLKDAAVATGLPIILGAQFNRTVTNPLRLHPTNIGEAGDIERIASLMLGFWNNDFEAVASDAELKEISGRGMDSSGTLYTTILKQRGGRANISEVLSWDGNLGLISNQGKQSNSTPF